MMSRSLWRGFDPPTNAAPAAQPESTEGVQCTLFVLRSQYVLFAQSLASASTKSQTECYLQAEDGSAGDDLMIGKRIQFHEETWQELRLLAAESMKSFQELADEAFNDLLKKHGRPASLKDALRKSAGQTAKVIPLKRRGRPFKGRS